MNGNGLPKVPALILPVEHAGIVLHGIISESGIVGASLITREHTAIIAQILDHRGGGIHLREHTQLDGVYRESVARANAQMQGMPRSYVTPAPAQVAQAPAFVPAPVQATPVAPAFPTFAPVAPVSPGAPPNQASAAAVPLAPPQAISGDRPPGLTSPVVDVTPLG